MAAVHQHHNVANSAQVPPPPQFFVDSRRSEVQELKNLLRSVQSDRDMNKKRETIKKVILYMTLGVDVSRLFPEMVMASHTDDLVQKKMIYLYISTYAHLNQDLAILAVNTLQKDSKDHDPTIRGLALRSLASLRVANLIEHLDPVVRAGLKDANGYVRRAAVMAVLKMNEAAPEFVEDGDWKDIVYSMLNDADSNVVTTAINVLNELEAGSGGLKISRPLAINLLNRLKTFSEWGQSTVLNVISAFIPSSDDELFDVFNVLEERLKHSSSAVVLSCINCFITLTKNRPHLQRQVVSRLRSPLLTLCNNPSPEVAWVVLEHVLQLLNLRCARQIFADDFKAFFCRFSDPSFIKLARISILVRIANRNTASAIVDEISESTQDPSPDVGARALKALAEIAVQIPSAGSQAISLLTSFLDVRINHLASSALEALAEVVLVQPELFYLVKENVSKLLEALSGASVNSISPAGVSALLSIVGAHGNEIETAPYVLETYIEALENDPSLASSEVKLALLACTFRLFVCRPPETQRLLGSVFSICLGDDDLPDLRDKALFYYRMIMLDPQFARKVICASAPLPDLNSKCPNGMLNLLHEFNTLSVIYNKPAEQFLNPQITPLPPGGLWVDSIPEGYGQVRSDEEQEDIANYPEIIDGDGMLVGEDLSGNVHGATVDHHNDEDDDDDIILPSQRLAANSRTPPPRDLLAASPPQPHAVHPLMAGIAPTLANSSVPTTASNVRPLQPPNTVRSFLDDPPLPSRSVSNPPVSSTALSAGSDLLGVASHPQPATVSPAGADLLGLSSTFSPPQQRPAANAVSNPFAAPVAATVPLTNVGQAVHTQISATPTTNGVSPPASLNQSSSLVLTSFFPLAPVDFEKGWTTAPCDRKSSKALGDPQMFANLAHVKQLLHAVNIFVLASRPGKFFAYAREASGKMLLVDLMLNNQTGNIDMVIKFGPVQASSVAEIFENYAWKALGKIIS